MIIVHMITLTILSLIILLVSVTQIVFASSDNDDTETEKCAVKLHDGRWLELDRPNNVTLNDGRVIIGHNCEQLQQDWANTTYAEYQQWLEGINEARERMGEEFGSQPSLSEQLKELNEKLDEFNNN